MMGDSVRVQEDLYTVTLPRVVSASGARYSAGGVTYALQTGGNAATAGSFGTIKVNTDGTYTYTLTSPFDTSPDANNGTNSELAESFTYVATDANGNTTTGVIRINIVDDVPTAVGLGEDLERAHRRILSDGYITS